MNVSYMLRGRMVIQYTLCVYIYVLMCENLNVFVFHFASVFDYPIVCVLVR